jgi:hypothetical protein
VVWAACGGVDPEWCTVSTVRLPSVYRRSLD